MDILNYNKPISTIEVQGNTFDIRDRGLEEAVSEQIDKIWNKLNKTISLVHNCANCGATLNIEENKPVFHCKYCGSTYLVGTAQIYSNY